MKFKRFLSLESESLAEIARHIILELVNSPNSIEFIIIEPFSHNYGKTIAVIVMILGHRPSLFFTLPFSLLLKWFVAENAFVKIGRSMLPTPVLVIFSKIWMQ